MEINFLNLIGQAKAQGADTIAAPTFPWTPPGGPPTPDPGDQDTGPKIALSTDNASVKVGDDFVVRVSVDTEETITGFSVSISYDPNFFLVIDSDEETEGVQVDYIDTSFIPNTNSVNSESGIINIRTETEEGQESSLSRTVAEIHLQARKAGTSEITINKENSNLLSTTGVDILNTANSLNINIAQKTVPIVTEEEPEPYIPKTALTDHAGLILGSTGGFLLIIAGIYLNRRKRK